jgi:hypothetical protein
MGDGSWLHMITSHLHLPVDQRGDPLRGPSNLNLGSYVAYALALKAYSKDFKPGSVYPPPANEATRREPIVPLKQVPIAQFEAHKPFQYALLAQSPGFTPPTSDALIPIFRGYIDFET